jgi:hypothetical protein
MESDKFFIAPLKIPLTLIKKKEKYRFQLAAVPFHIPGDSVLILYIRTILINKPMALLEILKRVFQFKLSEVSDQLKQIRFAMSNFIKIETFLFILDYFLFEGNKGKPKNLSHD